MRKIEKVRTIAPGISLIYFSTWQIVSLQWAKFAEADTVFANLDDSEYSTRCRMAANGYALRWPDGMDWSAGAVFKAGKLLNPPDRDGIANGKDMIIPAGKPHSGSGSSAGGTVSRKAL